MVNCRFHAGSLSSIKTFNVTLIIVGLIDLQYRLNIELVNDQWSNYEIILCLTTRRDNLLIGNHLLLV